MTFFYGCVTGFVTALLAVFGVLWLAYKLDQIEYERSQEGGE